MATPPPPPPPNGDGQFLLHLLLHGSSANAPPICTTATTTTTTTPPHHAPSPWHLLDPAVAALGPSHPLPDARPPPLLHSFSDIFHPLPTFPDHYPFLPPPPPLYAPVFSPQDVPWPPHSFPRQRPLPDSLPHDTVPSLSTLQKPSFPPFGCNGVEIDENLRGNHLSQSPANRSPFERASLPQFGCNLVEIDENLRGNHLGQSPSNRSPFERPSMPQIGCNGVEIDENLRGNHLGQSPSNRSPFERPSMLGQEAFRPAFGVSSRSSVENDLGRIGPLMGRDKAFPWNMTQEGLGDVWTPTRPACGLKERDRSSSLDLCQQVVCEPETLYRTKSEGVEPPPARVLEAEGDWSRYGAGTGVQGDEMLTDQRGVYQVNHELESPTLDWEGWNATNNDPAHSANHSTSHEDFHLDASRWNDSENLVKHLDPEDMRGTCTQNKTKYGRQIGQHRLKRQGNNAALRHWVATSREKHDDEDGVGKVEAAGSSEFELPEIASKSNVGFSEAAVPVNSQEGVTPQKPREGPKKRNQQWRLKQPLDANHISPGCMDSGSKPKDFVQKNFRIENPQLFQQDHVGLPSGTNLDSAPASATEPSTLYADRGKEAGPAQMESAFYMGKENETAAGLDVGEEEEEEVILGCVGFLDLDNDSEAEERKCSVHKLGGSLTSMDFVSEVIQDDLCREVNPSRQTITRFHKRDVPTRLGMEKWTGQLLSVFQTLIPSEDEELRRKQLLSSLEGIVSKKWPEARLYLFGSCANTFGVCNSDIDVCLSIDGQHTTKPELVLRLADMLQANHMQKVQALTHARVPIVKYSDPTTGISCDVCVNNMLAVVNTKLLHDYAQIDVRLRQLAFIVKHWAKCRQVNETYCGTLSSYAYVLMCIHFLQQRKPAVLPCLQEMEPTYQVTVGNIKCAYYDQVGKLTNFGSRNKETLGELLTSFFEYWAFRHDYSHAVISIRTGGFISKIEKDWTRRIGNERHLICIEDPFEISHDLGRVVDKHSIRFLREEFQRAAKIMRHHSNPCVALFEPYRPGKS